MFKSAKMVRLFGMLSIPAASVITACEVGSVSDKETTPVSLVPVGKFTLTIRENQEFISQIVILKDRLTVDSSDDVTADFVQIVKRFSKNSSWVGIAVGTRVTKIDSPDSSTTDLSSMSLKFELKNSSRSGVFSIPWTRELNATETLDNWLIPQVEGESETITLANHQRITELVRNATSGVGSTTSSVENILRAIYGAKVAPLPKNSSVTIQTNLSNISTNVQFDSQVGRNFNLVFTVTVTVDGESYAKQFDVKWKVAYNVSDILTAWMPSSRAFNLTFADYNLLQRKLNAINETSTSALRELVDAFNDAGVTDSDGNRLPYMSSSIRIVRKDWLNNINTNQRDFNYSLTIEHVAADTGEIKQRTINLNFNITVAFSALFENISTSRTITLDSARHNAFKAAWDQVKGIFTAEQIFLNLTNTLTQVDYTFLDQFRTLEKRAVLSNDNSTWTVSNFSSTRPIYRFTLVDGTAPAASQSVQAFQINFNIVDDAQTLLNNYSYFDESFIPHASISGANYDTFRANIAESALAGTTATSAQSNTFISQLRVLAFSTPRLPDLPSGAIVKNLQISATATTGVHENNFDITLTTGGTTATKNVRFLLTITENVAASVNALVNTGNKPSIGFYNGDNLANNVTVGIEDYEILRSLHDRIVDNTANPQVARTKALNYLGTLSRFFPSLRYTLTSDSIIVLNKGVLTPVINNPHSVSLVFLIGSRDSRGQVEASKQFTLNFQVTMTTADLLDRYRPPVAPGSVTVAAYNTFKTAYNQLKSDIQGSVVYANGDTYASKLQAAMRPIWGNTFALPVNTNVSGLDSLPDLQLGNRTYNFGVLLRQTDHVLGSTPSLRAVQFAFATEATGQDLLDAWQISGKYNPATQKINSVSIGVYNRFVEIFNGITSGGNNSYSELVTALNYLQPLSMTQLSNDARVTIASRLSKVRLATNAVQITFTLTLNGASKAVTLLIDLTATDAEKLLAFEEALVDHNSIPSVTWSDYNANYAALNNLFPDAQTSVTYAAFKTVLERIIRTGLPSDASVPGINITEIVKLNPLVKLSPLNITFIATSGTERRQIALPFTVTATNAQLSTAWSLPGGVNNPTVTIGLHQYKSLRNEWNTITPHTTGAEYSSQVIIVRRRIVDALRALGGAYLNLPLIEFARVTSRSTLPEITASSTSSNATLTFGLQTSMGSGNHDTRTISITLRVELSGEEKINSWKNEIISAAIPLERHNQFVNRVHAGFSGATANADFISALNALAGGNTNVFSAFPDGVKLKIQTTLSILEGNFTTGVRSIAFQLEHNGHTKEFIVTWSISASSVDRAQNALYTIANTFGMKKASGGNEYLTPDASPISISLSQHNRLVGNLANIGDTLNDLITVVSEMFYVLKPNLVAPSILDSALELEIVKNDLARLNSAKTKTAYLHFKIKYSPTGAGAISGSSTDSIKLEWAVTATTDELFNELDVSSTIASATYAKYADFYNAYKASTTITQNRTGLISLLTLLKTHLFTGITDVEGAVPSNSEFLNLEIVSDYRNSIHSVSLILTIKHTVGTTVNNKTIYFAIGQLTGGNSAYVNSAIFSTASTAAPHELKTAREFYYIDRVVYTTGGTTLTGDAAQAFIEKIQGTPMALKLPSTATLSDFAIVWEDVATLGPISDRKFKLTFKLTATEASTPTSKTFTFFFKHTTSAADTFNEWIRNIGTYYTTADDFQAFSKTMSARPSNYLATFITQIRTKIKVPPASSRTATTPGTTTTTPETTTTTTTPGTTTTPTVVAAADVNSKYFPSLEPYFLSLNTSIPVNGRVDGYDEENAALRGDIRFVDAINITAILKLHNNWSIKFDLAAPTQASWEKNIRLGFSIPTGATVASTASGWDARTKPVYKDVFDRLRISNKLFYTLADIINTAAVKSFEQKRPSYKYTGHYADLNKTKESYKNARNLFDALSADLAKSTAGGPYTSGSSGSTFALPLGRSYANATIQTMTMEPFVVSNATVGGSNEGITNASENELPLGYYDYTNSARPADVFAAKDAERNWYVQDKWSTGSNAMMAFLKHYPTSKNEDAVEWNLVMKLKLVITQKLGDTTYTANRTIFLTTKVAKAS